MLFEKGKKELVSGANCWRNTLKRDYAKKLMQEENIQE